MALKTLQDKTILLTGFTSGIGLQTARQLAGMGAELILIGRSALSGNGIALEIKRESDNPKISVLQADLSEKEDIDKLLVALRKRVGKIDCLINNAGAIFRQRENNSRQIERTLAVNHLAYFHLTLAILDLLEKSGDGRIVNVASDAHRKIKKGIEFEDLMFTKKYDPFYVYAHSKLANLLFTFELARRLTGKRVTVNALHPGMIASNIARNYPAVISWLWKTLLPGPATGAATSVFLASSPVVQDQTGKYWIKKEVATASAQARDPEAAVRLWKISNELLGTDY